MSKRRRERPSAAKPDHPSWFRPAPPRCRLCLEALAVPGEFWCSPCGEHQRRCAATARRVNRGRKVDRLSPAEERGHSMRAPQ